METDTQNAEQPIPQWTPKWAYELQRLDRMMHSPVHEALWARFRTVGCKHSFQFLYNDLAASAFNDPAGMSFFEWLIYELAGPTCSIHDLQDIVENVWARLITEYDPSNTAHNGERFTTLWLSAIDMECRNFRAGRRRARGDRARKPGIPAEQKVQIHAALNHLTKRESHAVWEVCCMGRTIPDVANELEVSESTIDKDIGKAKDKLAVAIGWPW